MAHSTGRPAAHADYTVIVLHVASASNATRTRSAIMAVDNLFAQSNYNARASDMQYFGWIDIEGEANRSLCEATPNGQ